MKNAKQISHLDQKAKCKCETFRTKKCEKCERCESESKAQPCRIPFRLFLKTRLNDRLPFIFKIF